MLSKLLEQLGEYIVLRDFNLYYPLWCRLQNPAAYKAADQLVDILQLYKLNLTLLYRLVT